MAYSQESERGGQRLKLVADKLFVHGQLYQADDEDNSE